MSLAPDYRYIRRPTPAAKLRGDIHYQRQLLADANREIEALQANKRAAGRRGLGANQTHRLETAIRDARQIGSWLPGAERDLARMEAEEQAAEEAARSDIARKPLNPNA